VFTFGSQFDVRVPRSVFVGTTGQTNTAPHRTWTRTEHRAPGSYERHLSLSLLVLGVRADDADDAAPAHHLALVANSLNRRSYLHI